VQSGAVSWAKATTLVEQAAVLDGPAARVVESRVLPAAAARTPAQHADAVRRAVDRVDPAAADARRQRAERDIELIRRHVGDGMGELFARMTSEQLDTVWLAADAWARRRKAGGDGRTLDRLRVDALAQWGKSFLTHGEASRCDVECEPAEGNARAPRRHDRPLRLTVLWDLTSLLGLSDDCGELADSGATLPPNATRELLAAGATVRRLLIDSGTGELLDLSAGEALLPPVAQRSHGQLAAQGGHSPLAEQRRHGPLVELHVVTTTQQWQAMCAGDDTGLGAALANVSPQLRDLLLAPPTAANLDETPGAYPTPTRLAEFVGVRDRHPTNPGAGLCAARSGDVDHVISVRDGGPTVRENLHSPTRRWHRLRTFGGWSVVRQGRGWRWTSWTGRTVTTRPHDYRLGP
jgi:hypothetical protein